MQNYTNCHLIDLIQIDIHTDKEFYNKKFVHYNMNEIN